MESTGPPPDDWSHRTGIAGGYRVGGPSSAALRASRRDEQGKRGGTTALRPVTAHQIRAFPAREVVYRHPALRAIAGSLMAGETVLAVMGALGKFRDGDQFHRYDAPLIPALYLMIAGVYLFTSTSVRLSPTNLEIHNLVRRITIPLGQITRVICGVRMCVITPDGVFPCLGVQAANVQGPGRWGTQGALADLIERVAAVAPRDANAKVVQVRRRPDAFLALTAGVNILAFVSVLAFGSL